MNNIYHWHNEVMVNLEMESFKREMDAIRLLHDVGLSNPSPLDRAMILIGRTLAGLGDRMQKRYTDPHQAYQVTSSKLAV